MPSSVIRQFAYDPARHELDVTFVSGRIYRYFAVPEAVAERLTRATSKGRYFNTRIRNRFTFAQVDTLH